MRPLSSKMFVFAQKQRLHFLNENDTRGCNGPKLNMSSEKETETGKNGSGATGKITAVQKRHDKIREIVQAQRFVTIETLAQACAVTPQTIRRDIATLSRKGWLTRYHGGVAIPTSTENVAYNQRKVLCFREKQKIARLLASHIPNNASLFINIGTTTEAIALALSNHKHLRIITNNLNVASIMSANENFEVIVAGGLVRHRDQGIIGEATIDFISQFKVDYGIIGISGIDSDGTLLDFDYREVRAARAIMDNSRNVFLAADHTKFGHVSYSIVAPVDVLDKVVTDSGIRAEDRQALGDRGVEVIAIHP